MENIAPPVTEDGDIDVIKLVDFLEDCGEHTLLKMQILLLAKVSNQLRGSLYVEGEVCIEGAVETYQR